MKKKKHLIKSISLSKLKRYKNNPRTHDEKQIEILVQNIKTNGYINPIIVDKKMVIIAGHGRHQALEIIHEGKDPKINVVIADLTPKEARKQRIADNKIGELSKWDEELLSQEIMSIFDKVSRDAIEMDTGFGEKELVAMGGDFESLFDDGMGDTNKDDEIPNKVKKVTKKGDLWELGNHRLLCGDATKEKDIKNVVKSNKIDLIFTDPPYGIGIVRNNSIGGSKPFGKNRLDNIIPAGNYKPIIGDKTIKTAIKSFKACDCLPGAIKIFWGGNFYCHELPPAKCWIVWDKETDGNFGDGEIAYCTASKSIRIFRHKWSGMIKASEKRQKRVHPTQKPIALSEWAFSEFIPKKKNVFDGFLGSGSTLIACEKTNRICYGMELDPHYCDVIRQRYIDFCKANNKKPIVKRNGKIFKV